MTNEGDRTHLFSGEIISCCFDPDDMPDSITVTLRCPRDTSIGHWFVDVVEAPSSRFPHQGSSPAPHHPVSTGGAGQQS